MTEWKTGQTILDDYLIEQELGRGGMGRVGLAKSNSTARLFVVKRCQHMYVSKWGYRSRA